MSQRMLEIAVARPSDIPALRTIAIAAKGHWGYPEDWMARWAQSSIISESAWQAEPPSAIYCAILNGARVGWYRLSWPARLHIPATSTTQEPAILEDLWVLPGYRGQGIGRCLFQHALKAAEAMGISRVEFDADPNAQPFYECMGCRVIGEVISEWGRPIPYMQIAL